MSIFTEKSFERFKDKLFVIHPMSSEKITGVGYDLNIGYYLKIENDQIVEQGEVDRQTNNQISPLILSSNSSLLIVTYEHAYLSNRVAGQIHIRATYAAQGIFMNSTTVDPCWDGQQVFLLSNFSPRDVEISLTEHFCTLVLHDVKHRSYLSPNNTRSVLTKYVKTYQGDTNEIFSYIIETNQGSKIIRDYKNKVDQVKSITNQNEIFLQIYFIFDLIKSNKWLLFRVILLSTIFIISLLSLYFRANIAGLIEQNPINTINILGSMGSFISAVIAIVDIYNKSKS